MPALLSAASGSLLAALLRNYSLDCRVSSLARTSAEPRAPAASSRGCPVLRHTARGAGGPAFAWRSAPEGLRKPAVPTPAALLRQRELAGARLRGISKDQ